MIKFFRHIRKKLLTENRFSKYLLYAIGEIILVIIGILFALNINNQNELKKTEAKVEVIFEDILEELVLNVSTVDRAIKNYARREPILIKALSNQITYEDYSGYRNTRLASVTNHYNLVYLSQHSYNNLVQDMDAVPVGFKSVTKDLYHLYSSTKQIVENNNQRMIRMVERFNEVRQENYEWFSIQNSKKNDKKVNFMLKDFRYKNEVRRYRNNGVMKHLKYAIRFRTEAIECYEKIAILLNKPKIHPSFYAEASVTDRLLGKYEVEIDTTIAKHFLSETSMKEQQDIREFELFNEGDALYYIDPINERKTELIYVSDTLYVSQDPYYYTVETTNKEITLKMNYGWVYRKKIDNNK